MTKLQVLFQGIEQFCWTAILQAHFCTTQIPAFLLPNRSYLFSTFSRREMRQKIVMTKSQRNMEEKYGKTLKRAAENIIIYTFCR